MYGGEVGRDAYLIPDSGIGNVVASLEVPNMHNYTLKIVRAGSSELVVLPYVLVAGPVCVGQHLEFQGKGYLGIDLGSRAYMLFEALESGLDMRF